MYEIYVTIVRRQLLFRFRLLLLIRKGTLRFVILYKKRSTNVV